MPCYADTIVRIKYVKQNVNEDINSLIVWALGTYPVDSEDYDIEMSLFVPIDQADRDLDSQAVFIKDNFFSVGGKIVPGFYEGNKRAKMTVSTSTHLTIHNRVDASNKCPLKISLIGIPQEMPNEINGDGIIQTLVTDYAGQEYNFSMKVVFPCNHSRFSFLKNNIRPRESFIFVVGQMEIISNEFYVYAKDVNYIDAQFLNKKSSFGCGGSQTSSSKKNIRSKLLATHQSFLEISKVKFEGETVASSSKSDHANKSELSSSDNLYSLKRARVEDFDGSVHGGSTACEDFTESVDGNFENDISIGLGSGFESNSVNSLCLPKQVYSDASEGSVGASYVEEVNDHADFRQKDDAEESVNNSSYQKKSKLQKGQESVGHTLRCNLRSRTSDASFSKV
ncbi:14394_t:CDS:2 [Cetraspora pellucida]|uniref:14394_t:CDS:1 n=1 Tax=Cetraspora pellucida TaxID=1433469 RepID=A0ACA9K2V1_9GLOM|nr:14394_t:CDS:2 [Cetraspora pellucida]